MKSMQYPDGILEEFSIGSGKMPTWQQKILTSTGALLFYGKVYEQQFGCVRLMESGRLDENGRKCYYNVAFAGTAEEENKVRDILNYARTHYQEFCRDMNSVLYYQGADYQVNKEEFINMFKKAQEAFDSKNSIEEGFLVPEGRAEDFFLNTQAPVDKDRIRIVTELKEVKKMQTTVSTDKIEKISDEKLKQMKLFFYCSSPSKGFHMKKISAVTGEVLLEGEEAVNAMPENAFEITTRSGARMALYQTAYGHCFVAKGMESVKADRYGRYKYANIAFEVSKEQELMITQLAAWALFDFVNFSVAVTDCMSVYDGPRGYEINREKLQQLLSRFDKKIYKIPSRYRKVWDKLVEQSCHNVFRFVVIDISFNHFRESTRISVENGQISYKLPIEEMEKWKKNPMMLGFSEDIYQDEQVKELTAQEKKANEVITQEEYVSEVSLQKECVSEASVKQATTQANSVKEITQQEHKTKEITVQEEDVEELIELEENNKEAEQETKDSRGEEGKDYIDLLNQKWFLPTVIGGVIMIGLFLFFLLKKLIGLFLFFLLKKLI